MRSAESVDSVATWSLTGFQNRTSATQFLSAPGTNAMLSAADPNSTLALRETDGLPEGPLPAAWPIEVLDTSQRRPLSVSTITTSETPLPPSGAMSVDAVRKATRCPLSLIEGWSEVSSPAAPDGVAETSSVRIRMYAGTFVRRALKRWVGIRNVRS